MPTNTRKKLFTAALLCLALLGLSACASSQTATTVHNTSALLVTTVDQATTVYLDGLAQPSEKQLEVTGKVVDALKVARDALNASEELIRSGQSSEGEIRLALTAVREAVDLLSEHGVPIPEAVLVALEQLELTPI